MRTQWTAKGNRDACSSCSCDRGLHRYLRNWTPPKPPSSVRHWLKLCFVIDFSDTTLLFCYVHVTVHRNKFLFNKTNRRTNFFLIYFYQETLHVSGSSSAHHQEFSTVHSALVYIMQDWWQLSSTSRMELLGAVFRNLVSQLVRFHPGRTWKLSSFLHDIYQCPMYSGKLLMMGRGTDRNM